MVAKKGIFIIFVFLLLVHVAHADNITNTGPVGKSLVEYEDTKIVLNINTGETIIFQPRKEMAIKEFKLIFAEDTSRLTLLTQQYNELPAGIPTAPSEVYKYLNVEANALDKVAGFELKFRVSPAFFKDKSFDEFTIWLLQDGEWKSYKPTEHVVDARGDYVFVSNLPTLGWMALGFYVPPPPVVIEVPPTPKPVETVPDQPIVEENTTPETPAIVPEKPQQEKPQSIITKPAATTTKISPLIALLGLVLIAVLLGLMGVQIYKVYTRKKEEHQRVVEQDQQEYQIKKKIDPNHPFAQMQEYIFKLRAKKIEDGEIKKRLINVGWDEVIVDQEMQRDR